MGMEYSMQYHIGYFGTDSDLCLTPSSLAVYLQDLAIAHSNAIGYTLEWLAERKKGWAIINWHIIINRLPHFGETIKVVTWSTKCRRMQAERSFEVLDEKGNVIVSALSRWIFMDLAKRTPCFIENEMEEKYTCKRPMAIENEKYSMPKEQRENFSAERIFTVTRRDTDTNGHTNNTKYIEWAMDDIPDDIYEQYKTADIKVVYRRECYKGSQVCARCYVFSKETGEKEVVSFFLDAEDTTTVFAQVATIWIKKELI